MQCNNANCQQTAMLITTEAENRNNNMYWYTVKVEFLGCFKWNYLICAASCRGQDIFNYSFNICWTYLLVQHNPTLDVDSLQSRCFNPSVHSLQQTKAHFPAYHALPSFSSLKESTCQKSKKGKEKKKNSTHPIKAPKSSHNYIILVNKLVS